ncbi:hypothetical protein JCM3775_000515 [Rhodotorula graminis]
MTPTFRVHDDGDDSSQPASRSTSRERPHLPQLVHHSSSHVHARRYSNESSAGTHTPPPQHHLLCDVDEEAALDSPTAERAPLLANGHGPNPHRSTPKRRLTLPSNGYGSLTAAPGFVALNEDGGGAAIKRTESVLRVAGLIDDRAGEFEHFRKSDDELKRMSKKVRDFYVQQNETLDQFAEVDDVLESARAKQATGELIPSTPPDTTRRDDDLRASVRWAVNVNTLVNVVLLGAKIGVVLLSHSMSLIASTVDSAMDFLSTLIIFGTTRVIEHRSWQSQFAYPTGKQRMEPLGILSFSVFMISSFMQVGIESIQRLCDPHLEQTHLPPIAIATMVGTIVVKGAVWLSCRAIKSASVEALQQDAENDIVFNFFSLLFPYIGQLVKWPYLDPLGGAVLSLYIIVEWTRTLLDNVGKLTGRRADPHEHQRIAYLLTRFSPLVTAIQHLSIYHAGEGLIVECDAVLPPETSLTVAHNIGEAAQYAIEQLSGIERAFVHIDVSSNPLSGHLER